MKIASIGSGLIALSLCGCSADPSAVHDPGTLDGSEDPSSLQQPLTAVVALGTRHDPTNQKEFNFKNNSGSRRKFVHEVVATKENVRPILHPLTHASVVGETFTSKLALRMKLEWKGSRSGGWKVAGEERTIEYDLDVTVAILNVQGISSTPVQRRLTGSVTRSSDLVLELGAIGANWYHGTATPKWQVEVTGTITQHMTGDVPGNRWTNYRSIVAATPDCTGGCWYN